MDTKRRARELRRDMTDAERKLWLALRDRRLDGVKFRRQVPIGPWIVDVLCKEAALVVEVDGGQHSESVRDGRRDAWLEAEGYRIVRIWNNDVLGNLHGVLEHLQSALGGGRGEGAPAPSLCGT